MEVDNTPLKKVEKTILFFKKYWAKWIFFLIGLSITLLFSFSLIFDKDIQLQIINNWIGIILGLVATIASIISLFLSFYNLEQERDEARENRQLMNDLKNTLIELEKTQIDINQRIDQQVKETVRINRKLNMHNRPTLINNNATTRQRPNDRVISERIRKTQETTERRGNNE